MKKMKNLYVIFALALAATMTLSGCSGNVPAANPPATDPVAEITPEEPATEAPTVEEPVTEEPEEEEPAFVTVDFMTDDEIKVTADLYKIEDDSAPYIILFHMGDSSRGEYLEIAPRLNEMGYSCLAVDTRKGMTKNGVGNKTAKAAEYKYFAVYDYAEAWHDVRATLSYVKEELKAEKIIIWGSSYTSSLALVSGSEFPEDISAILAFSPGEYFKLDDKTVGDYAANVKCPVFVTAESVSEWPDSPYDYAGMATELYEKIPFENKTFFMPDGIPGKHGSAVLFSSYENNELYWEQVVNFLNNL